MDLLFLELIGKSALKAPKIITVVADNFSFLEDQARFLKATLGLSQAKELNLKHSSQRLIQIGHLQREIGDLAHKYQWVVNQYEDMSDNICDRMAEDLINIGNRSIMFINDVSRLELWGTSQDESVKLIALADKLRRLGHFVVLLYQNSSCATSTFLRNLEYISDAVARVKTCKVGYFKHIWWESPNVTTLIPPKVETCYYTCKIGQLFWSPDLMCFHERTKVGKNYDFDSDTCLKEEEAENGDLGSDDEDISDSLSRSKITDKPSADEKDSTLPYTKAQNPEQSRIFYYPDKEDDIDEDDPDNDLGI